MTPSIRILLASAAALPLLATSSRAAQEQAPALPPLDIQWGRLQWGALSPDGRELGLAGQHAGLVLLDLATGRVRLTIPHHRGVQVAGQEIDLEDAAWSPSGKLLARLYEDGRVELVSTVDGALIAAFATPPPLEDVPFRVRRSVRFASEDRLLVAYGNTPAEIWSIPEQRRVAEIATPEGPATALAISRNGELVALGDHAGNVGIWRTRTGESTGKGYFIEHEVLSLAFHPDASMLAIGAEDADVRLWSLGGSGTVRTITYRPTVMFDSLRIGCVAFSPDGTRLLTTSTALLEANLWDLATGRELWRHGVDGGNEEGLWAIFFGGGQRVLLDMNGIVVDAEAGKVLKTLVPGRERDRWVRSDGKKAWTINEGRLLVFSLSGDCEQLLDLPITRDEAK